MTLVMPVEIPTTTRTPLGIGRLALPRVSLAGNTVPMGRGELVGTAGRALDHSRTWCKLSVSLCGVRRTGPAFLPRRGAVSIPRPIRAIRRRGGSWGHGPRLLNVSCSATRVSAEHEVVLPKNLTPCVVRVADLNLDVATADSQNPLGLLDDPFRDGNAAVRLGK